MTTTDRRPALFDAYEHAAVVVSTIEPGQLGLPTSCAQYDVATMVDHIVGAGHRAAAMGRGEAVGPEEFPHIELADAPEELRRAGKEAEAAWSEDARLAASITMPWGETYTGSTVVDMYLAELAAHAWDLASATGRLDRLDPGLAPVALEAARDMLKPEYRNLVEEGSPYGSEVEPPADATDWERFAAFMGREPRG
ncbi:MAG TPA: TIGR03086 family metal-binding protein [Acidimicrobiales bacterium]|nr:TIGR03086 family metal-binding protein [Acidimicrobiales bacterium]